MDVQHPKVRVLTRGECMTQNVHTKVTNKSLLVVDKIL